MKPHTKHVRSYAKTMIILKDENNVITSYDPTKVDIKPEQYLTYMEVLDTIFNELAVEDLNIIQNMKYDNLIALHSGLGMWIRNTFGFWHEDNALTNSGLYDDDKHPDNLSFSMIQRMWHIIQASGIPEKTVKSVPFDI